MDIINYINKLEENLKIKEDITETIKNKQIEKAKAEYNYKHLNARTLLRLRDNKVPTVIVLKVAEGELSKELFDIDKLEIEIRYLKEKLENIRQDIEVYRSLIKNERELIQC